MDCSILILCSTTSILSTNHRVCMSLTYVININILIPCDLSLNRFYLKSCGKDIVLYLLADVTIIYFQHALLRHKCFNRKRCLWPLKCLVRTSVAWGFYNILTSLLFFQRRLNVWRTIFVSFRLWDQNSKYTNYPKREHHHLGFIQRSTYP